jgi:hypothetical protein
VRELRGGCSPVIPLNYSGEVVPTNARRGTFERKSFLRHRSTDQRQLPFVTSGWSGLLIDFGVAVIFVTLP